MPSPCMTTVVPIFVLLLFAFSASVIRAQRTYDCDVTTVEPSEEQQLMTQDAAIAQWPRVMADVGIDEEQKLRDAFEYESTPGWPALLAVLPEEGFHMTPAASCRSSRPAVWRQAT